MKPCWSHAHFKENDSDVKDSLPNGLRNAICFMSTPSQSQDINTGGPRKLDIANNRWNSWSHMQDYHTSCTRRCIHRTRHVHGCNIKPIPLFEVWRLLVACRYRYFLYLPPSFISGSCSSTSSRSSLFGRPEKRDLSVHLRDLMSLDMINTVDSGPSSNTEIQLSSFHEVCARTMYFYGRNVIDARAFSNTDQCPFYLHNSNYYKNTLTE